MTLKKWNWQQPEWPNFTWDPVALQLLEGRFLRQSGVALGARTHLSGEDDTHLLIELMSTEALGTSKIESETLDRDSVQASIRRHLGLQAGRRPSPAEDGVAGMMVDLYKNFQKPLSEKMLFHWHEMLVGWRWDLSAVGFYRFHKDPMQIVSGSYGRERVHFEAPPSDQIPNEMARLLQWVEDTSPAGKNPLPALSRAGIAHLWFESLHPFEDGNGRVGRGIIEKLLAESLGHPMFTGISSAILRQRKEYYDTLGRTNRTLEVTDWLQWFARSALEAQQRTLGRVIFVIKKGKLLSSTEGFMNKRQMKAVKRVMDEGIDGFKGGLSANNYMRITGASASTAGRDLASLVELGVLRRTGEKKGARYHLSILPLPDELESPGNSFSP